MQPSNNMTSHNFIQGHEKCSDQALTWLPQLIKALSGNQFFDGSLKSHLPWPSIRPVLLTHEVITVSADADRFFI